MSEQVVFPLETWAQIMRYSTPSVLKALMQSSRMLHWEAKRQLYHTIIVSGPIRESERGRVGDPADYKDKHGHHIDLDLATWVRDLKSFWLNNSDDTGSINESTAFIVQAYMRLSKSDSVEAEDFVAVAQCIAASTRLSVFYMTLPWNHLTPGFQAKALAAMSTPKITSLIAPFVLLAKQEFPDRRVIRKLCDDVVNMFRVPVLRQLGMIVFDWSQYRVHTLGSLTLTHLELNTCYQLPRGQKASWPGGIQELTLRAPVYGSNSIKGQSVVDMLESVGTTLERLVLDMKTCPYSASSPFTLGHFVRLQTLEAPLAFFKRDEQFHTHFPDSLRGLTLESDSPYGYGREARPEEMSGSLGLLKAVEQFAIHRSQHQNLKEVHLVRGFPQWVRCNEELEQTHEFLGSEGIALCFRERMYHGPTDYRAVLRRCAVISEMQSSR